ncbi:Sigma-70 region 2 [Pedobacter sp. ok626]|uniref:RNA polymerase sigma factor n=1 Tax=Pedobacter sp. ok626 TaxID=1761882 RepID=UPI00088D8E6C|nr:RNA polymerase sigma-70 factor [Pedobacter sp. ok626]SDL15860.1 Sigma-70 region 2 [Pedobacter sp. ok626]
MNTYSNFPDVQLVDLMRESDDAAFIEIFNRYYILLFSFTCRRLNDKEVSKDLIYDAFAYIWEKRDTINIPGELIAFLYTVIKNRIVDHYKHQKVRQKYVEDFQRCLDQRQNSTDHLVRHNYLNARIEREIAALPEKMRVVFELSRKKAMNRQEISEHLDMPENTVKTNLQRALRILRGKLELDKSYE